jgi:hypothetical protein
MLHLRQETTEEMAATIGREWVSPESRARRSPTTIVGRLNGRTPSMPPQRPTPVPIPLGSGCSMEPASW